MRKSHSILSMELNQRAKTVCRVSTRGPGAINKNMATPVDSMALNDIRYMNSAHFSRLQKLRAPSGRDIARIEWWWWLGPNLYLNVACHVTAARSSDSGNYNKFHLIHRHPMETQRNQNYVMDGVCGRGESRVHFVQSARKTNGDSIVRLKDSIAKMSLTRGEKKIATSLAIPKVGTQTGSDSISDSQHIGKTLIVLSIITDEKVDQALHRNRNFCWNAIDGQRRFTKIRLNLLFHVSEWR